MTTKQRVGHRERCHCDRPDCFEPEISQDVAEELLEACKEAYAYLQYNHGQGNKAFELCGKAISKAEGRA